MSKDGVTFVGINEALGDLVYKLEPENIHYSDIPIVYYIKGCPEIDAFLKGNLFYELGLVFQLYSFKNAFVFKFVERSNAKTYGFQDSTYIFGVNRSRIISYEIVKEDEFDFVDDNFFINNFKKGVGGLILQGVASAIDKIKKAKTYKEKGHCYRLHYISTKNTEECIDTYVEMVNTEGYNIFLKNHFIKEISPTTKSSSEGCFIATACYGSYDCEEVLVFRKFRDDFLKNYKIGKMFIKFYYKTSPFLVEHIKNKKIITESIKKLLLTPIYKILK